MKGLKSLVDMVVDAKLVRFRPHQRVRYDTAAGGFKSHRKATVLEDNGRPKVKVRWYTAEGPRSHGGRIVAYHGHPVEHWTAREWLEI